jgi:hypothetical protein
MGNSVAEFISIAPAVANAVGAAAIVIGGVFAAFKWIDQRRRELEERRFEQYWKLVDISQETPFLAKQKIALLLLRKFPEFKEETIAFLVDARTVNSPWVAQNKAVIDTVLTYFELRQP